MASIFLFLLLLISASLLLSEAGSLLYSTRPLAPGEAYLKYNDYEVRLQKDCNLVYKGGGRLIWATNTTASACSWKMENNGELRIYDGQHKVLWTSKTTSHLGDYVFFIQSSNKNLVIAGPATWSTNTQSAKQLEATDPHINDANILVRFAPLYPGESLKNGIWELKLQRDCNLVLFENGNNVLWSTNTANKSRVCFLMLQGDGDLVVADGTTGKPIWNSNTKWAGPNFVLVLQNNRNLVLYGPDIWRSNTPRVGTGILTLYHMS